MPGRSFGQSCLFAILAVVVSACGGAPKRAPVVPPTPDRQSFNIKPPVNLNYDALLADVVAAVGSGSGSREALERTLRTLFPLVLSYASNLYGLSADESGALPSAFSSQAQVVNDQAAARLAALSVARKQTLPDETVTFSYRNYSAVALYADMFSSITCDVTSLILSTVAKRPLLGIASTLMAAPCATILVELVTPLFVELENAGLIRDNVNVRFTLTARLRETITELAVIQDTAEMLMSKTFSNQLLRFFTSSGEIELKVIAHIKAGFDLSPGLAVVWNDPARMVTVTLPEPTILSMDLRHQVVSIKDGLIRDVDAAAINDALALARQQLETSARRSLLLEAARRRGIQVVELLLGPLVNHPRLSYRISVQFR